MLRNANANASGSALPSRGYSHGVGRFLTRRYENAAFVLDRTVGTSVFVEGPLAPYSLACLESKGDRAAEARRLGIASDDLPTFLEDCAEIESAIRELSDPPKSGQRTGEPYKNEAIQRLNAYAVANWQIVNTSIETTYRCDLRCSWCYLDRFTDAGLPTLVLRRIGEELRKAGAVFISFTGGEFSLRSDALEILSAFDELDFAIEMKTNGMRLSPTFIGGLSRLPILDFQVSIYGGPEVEGTSTPSGYSLDQVLSNVKRARDAGLPVTLSVLVGRHNVAGLDKLHELLSKCEVEIFYTPYITPNRAGPGAETRLRLSAGELDSLFYPFLQQIGSYTPQGVYRDCSASDTVCYAGRDQIAIGPDGSVYPCLDLRLKLGNLCDEPLIAILARRRGALAGFTIRDMPCWNCEIRDYCDSCIGIAMVEHSDYRIPSPHKCDVARLYARPRGGEDT